MRFERLSKVVLSEDDVTSPKEIRFSEERTTIDNGTAAVLKDGGGTTITIPIATDFPLPMPQITTGKYLYLYADKAFAVKLDGSATSLDMLAKKVSELWFNYATAPSITTTEVTRLTYCIAGD